MKAISFTRCKLFLLMVILGAAAITMVGGREAIAGQSPYVSAAGPKLVAASHGALLKADEQHTFADQLNTALAATRAVGNARDRRPEDNSGISVDSVVQTLDYTLATESSSAPPIDNTPTNIDPVWSPSATFLVFSSNRTTSGTAGTTFHLWAISSTGDPSTLVQLTSGTGNERWPSLVSDTQIAYCGNTVTGLPYSLYVAGIANVSGKLVVQGASIIVNGTTLDCEHPSYGGDIIAFAGRTPGANYHIYYYSTSTALTTQLTGGMSDEENPSLAPNFSLISFDSNAQMFTGTSGGSPPLVSSGTRPKRNVFVSRLSGLNPVQLTVAPGTNNIESTWSYVPSGLVLNSGYYIWFSSDRVNAHYGIDYIYVIPQQNGNSIEYAEGVNNNPAQPLLTSDPVNPSTPTGSYDNLEPSVPNLSQGVYTVAYASPRFIVNNLTDNPLVNAATPAFASPNNEPANTPTNPPGLFVPTNTELSPNGGFEILASHIFAIDPPTLIRYSNNEIVHTETSFSNVSQNQTSRFIQAGGSVRFIVRLSDRQTGVGQAYLQIKDPNSRYQDAAGLEHKVYTRSPYVYNPATGAPLHPSGNEATELFQVQPSVAVQGYNFDGQIGGFDGGQPIQLGEHLTYPATSLGNTPPAATMTNTAIPGSTILDISGVDLMIAQNPESGEGTTHLAGAILNLYNQTGTAVIEQVQVIQADYNLGVGTSPITGTFIVTPLQNDYVTAASGAKIAYVSIAKAGGFDPGGFEVDCQAILAGTGGQVDGSNPANFVIPTYTAGIDDQAPLSGDGAVNPGGNVWLPLSPLPANDPEQDTNGGVLYVATWQTPNTASDYYLDTIGFDNAEDNPYLTSAGQNWRIYDNIWGFSTQPFISHTSPGGILIVNDYMLPQKFFGSERFGSASPSNIPSNFFGAESYITDIDADYADTAGQLASLPSTGFMSSTDANTTTMTELFHRPTGGYSDGETYTPFYPNGLGINSYVDTEQQGVTNPYGAPTPALLRTPLEDLTENNGPPMIPSQSYDMWRILSRGPLPQSILDTYAPQVIQQPADVSTPGSTPKNVLVASSCVLWCSPFAGDEFSDNGTITDLNTQAELTDFTANKGGRLFVEGINVGFALTNNGSFADPFYTSVLNAHYVQSDLNADTSTLTLIGSANQTDYISHDAFINNTNANYDLFSQVGHVNFKLADTTPSDTSPNWTYQPPSAGPLDLALLNNNIGLTSVRSDASLNDGGERIGGFIDGFSNTLTAPPTTGPIEPPVVTTPVEATEFKGSAATDQLVYSTLVSPSNVDYGSAIVAYSSFGIESLSQEASFLTPISPYVGVGNDYPVFSVAGQRTDTLHNIVCFLRTGTLTGVVTSTNGGQPEHGAEVSAYATPIGGFVNANNSIVFTALTDANGRFSIQGVPAGRYQLSAYLPGVTFQHVNGSFVDTHGGDTGIVNLQVAPATPGNLVVKVVSASAPAGVVGATVTVTEVLTGQSQPAQVTDSTGTVTFTSIPTGNYTVVVSAPNYATATATAAVSSGTTTTITVTLSLQPATVLLTVSNGYIGGRVKGATATLTPTGAGSPVSISTDINGQARFSGIAPGTYTLSVSYSGYATATSTLTLTPNEFLPVNVTIYPTPAATVSITSPASGTTFIAPANISLVATATARYAAIASVKFYANGTTLIGTATLSNGQYVYSWNAVPAATYVVTAVATNTVSGATTTSAPVTIKVILPPVPTVAITSPANGAKFTVPAPITLTASTSIVYGSVTSVTYYENGKLLATETTAPYTYIWSGTTAGVYTLQAVATSNLGVKGASAQITITVVDPTPTVTITSPASGSKYTALATVPLTATASVSYGSISSVSYYYNGTTLIGTSTAAPYLVDWTIGTGGTYSVTAVAKTNLGATGTSAPITITIVNPTPVVTLLTPTRGETFIAPATITFTASASVSYGTITRVAYYNGSALLGTTYTAPYTFVWKNVPVGVYTVGARVYDSAGATATSESATITVNPAPGRVFGLVTRGFDGKPVPGSTVSLQNTATGVFVTATTTSTTTTGPDGSPINFEIMSVPPGTYKVTVANKSYGSPGAASLTLPIAGSVRQDLVLQALGQLPAGLQLFSVPYDFSHDGLTLSQTLGDLPNPSLAVYLPASNSYAITPEFPADNLRLGQGYLARFPRTVSFIGAGTTAPTTQPFAIHLSAGWNMIGDPFFTSVPIGNLTFTDSSGSTYGFVEATGAPASLVNGTLYTLTPASTSYTPLNSGGSLSPYGGYWIQVFRACTLNVPPPSVP